MEWTFEDFGADLKDLNPKVRQKALKIANRLREKEGYSKGEAIKQAEEWYLNRQA